VRKYALKRRERLETDLRKFEIARQTKETALGA
jgi:hypothetical protein